MRLPSIATIKTRLNVPAFTAKDIRRAMEICRDSEVSLYDSVPEALRAADRLINGHGVEYIRHSKDSMRSVRGIEYVNMGDTYTQTVLFDWSKGTFYVCDWGAIVESAPEGAYP